MLLISKRKKLMVYMPLEYLGGSRHSMLYVLLYAMFCQCVLFFILFFVIAYFKIAFCNFFHFI